MFLEFAPTGSPKYLKGRAPSLHSKKSHAITMNFDGTFTLIKKLLEIMNELFKCGGSYKNTLGLAGCGGLL